jgi:flagellar hook protein FlgE
MSLSVAMATALSLLNLTGSRVAAIADNVSNVSTTGFKTRKVRSSSLDTRQSGGGSAGSGVRGVVRQSVSVQGLLQATTSPTDLAISGNGLFPVRGGPAGNIGVRFTRSGGFTVDANGSLANAGGFQLLAYPTDAQGRTTSTALEPVDLGRVGGTAQATARINLGANLPADAAIGERVNVTAQIQDSLGNDLEVTLTFEKTAVNTHTLTIADPVNAGTGVVAGTASESASGGQPFAIDVVFNGDGSLQGFDTDRDGTVDGSLAPNLSIGGLSTGGSNMDIALDLGDANAFDGLTQFAGPFTIGHIDVDGAQFGTASGVDIGPDGLVTALFDNGERRPIYKVPLATFTNPDGLREISGNAFEATDASGPALFGTAGSGGAGSIQAASLERSNVDLASELTRLIEARTVYGMGLETLRTADEMMRDLIDIKA